jgi:hypothetical protein
MVVVVLVLGGCAVTMISLGNEVNKADEQAQEFAAVRDQISLGMTESEVLVIAGEPRFPADAEVDAELDREIRAAPAPARRGSPIAGPPVAEPPVAEPPVAESPVAKPAARG